MEAFCLLHVLSRLEAFCSLIHAARSLLICLLLLFFRAPDEGGTAIEGREETAQRRVLLLVLHGSWPDSAANALHTYSALQTAHSTLQQHKAHTTHSTDLSQHTAHGHGFGYLDACGCRLFAHVFATHRLGFRSLAG